MLLLVPVTGFRPAGTNVSGAIWGRERERQPFAAIFLNQPVRNAFAASFATTA